MSDRNRIVVAVPAIFVVPRPKPPEPPPFPGTVSVEDIRPPQDPPRPFLVPWAAVLDTDRTLKADRSLSVDINKEMLAKYLERHDVRHTLEEVFKDRGADAQSYVEDVLLSMLDPFRGNASSIVWQLYPTVQPNPSIDDKLGGKKLKNRHKILKGLPWSIASFVDDANVVRRNMVYDGDGDAIVQVDFGHGNSVGIHCHALVKGNLEHSSVTDENHLFHLHDVPWMWLAVPWGVSRESRPVADSSACLPTTVEDTAWVAVNVPFEDYMGDMERTGSSSN